MKFLGGVIITLMVASIPGTLLWAAVTQLHQWIPPVPRVEFWTADLFTLLAWLLVCVFASGPILLTRTLADLSYERLTKKLGAQ